MSRVKPTIKERILARIKAARRRNVFMRQDFDDMGSYNLIGNTLKQLLNEKKLVRVGYGLYTLARINQFNGRVIPDVKGGFPQIAREALNRLEVDWLVSDAVFDYMADKTTQIPAKLQLFVNKRFSRKITYKNYTVAFIPLKHTILKQKADQRSGSRSSESINGKLG